MPLLNKALLAAMRQTKKDPLFLYNAPGGGNRFLVTQIEIGMATAHPKRTEKSTHDFSLVKSGREVNYYEGYSPKRFYRCGILAVFRFLFLRNKPVLLFSCVIVCSYSRAKPSRKTLIGKETCNIACQLAPIDDHRLLTASEMHKVLKTSFSSHCRLVATHKMLIEKGLLKFAGNKKVLSKYLWLRKYRNAVIHAKLNQQLRR